MMLGVSRSVVSDSLRHVDCSSLGSFAQGLLQARILEWVATSLSRESSQARHRTRGSSLQVDSVLTEPHCDRISALITRGVGDSSLSAQVRTQREARKRPLTRNRTGLDLGHPAFRTSVRDKWMLFEASSAVVCESHLTFKDTTRGRPCPSPLQAPRGLHAITSTPPPTQGWVLSALLVLRTQLWASPLQWPLPGLLYPPLLPWFFQLQLFSITLQVASSQKCFLTVLSRKTALLFSLSAPCYSSSTALIKI